MTNPFEDENGTYVVLINDDHVIAPGQPAQQDGPGALEDLVEGQAVAASLTAERLGECFGQFDIFDFPRLLFDAHKSPAG
jgi:hypothetical protein